MNGIWLFLYGHWFQKRVRLCACACSIKQKQNLFSTYFRLLQYEIEQCSILECPKQHTAMFFPYSSYRNVIMYTTIIDRNYRLFGLRDVQGIWHQWQARVCGFAAKGYFPAKRFPSFILLRADCDLWTAFRHRISYSLLSLLLLWLDGGVAQLCLFAWQGSDIKSE